MLLKLVQSIQKSGREDGASGSGGCEKPDVGRLDKRGASRSYRQRPRSGCEITSGKSEFLDKLQKKTSNLLK